MRTQPTPMVDVDDVERVVRRDYPPHMVAEVLRRVDAIDEREKTRVVLACLKIANGDRQRLEGALRAGSADYRDVLLEAEYPLALEAEYPLAGKRWFRMDKLSDQERSSIYQRDWDQYVAWLGRDAVPTPSDQDE